MTLKVSKFTFIDFTSILLLLAQVSSFHMVVPPPRIHSDPLKTVSKTLQPVQVQENAGTQFTIGFSFAPD